RRDSISGRAARRHCTAAAATVPSPAMRALASLFAFVLCLSAGRQAVAQPDEVRAAGGADLARRIALAARAHPDLMVARAKLAQVRAQLNQARFAPFSQFKATGGVALAPTIRGGPVFSPNTDVSLTSNLGVAWRANINGVLPLWTFGKITNLWEA